MTRWPAVLTCILILTTLPAAAQTRLLAPDTPAPSPPAARPLSHCIALAQSAPGIEYIQKAAWTDPVPQGSVRLTYLAHAMVLIQSAGGTSVVTDYNGWTGIIPDAVTMNRAHSSHYTDRVPEGVLALRGWGESFGLPARHDQEVGDIRIRNVPTAIRSFGTVEENGNSIFVFETAGLCIGHLGHLHHTPTEAQYAALGRLDVVMAAVDGSMTIHQGEMVDILKRLRSSVVIPIHWFGEATLQRFVAGMEGSFDILRPGRSDLTVSLRGQPKRPTVVVLEPGG